MNNEDKQKLATQLLDDYMKKNKEAFQQAYEHVLLYGEPPDFKVKWCEDKNDVVVKIISKYTGIGCNCKEVK